MQTDPKARAQADDAPRRSGPILRALWACVGGVSLALGAVGVILPLLPTTPFVLLAAFAFARSSPRLRGRLVQSRVFGPIISEWEAHGVIAPRYKAMACGVMAAVLLASVLGGLAWRLIAIQAVCMTAAAAYVLSRPSRER